ncbi:MAG: YwaF family protein [Candidatus Pristimantibacillus lignocellulolyticus]|uniref:YwaF family protein n=1 Tax=Candidatus Pristimantibacillus lignocellulolyticus TaxID=2994561 RepID=A0A9J6ZJB3_9BACL|nr:MAG: YwaF family protein [Candidatus Pristimantibacillus lignocellulolyticus]
MEKGFEVFDYVHLNWLIAIVIISILITFIYTRCSPLQRDWMRKGIGYTLLIAEICKVIVVLATGRNLLYYLPIHLCGLAIFLVLLHAYRKSTMIAEILFSLTMPSAFIALLFPGWANDPVMSFLHIHSFVYHALILTYPIMLLATGEMKPRIRRLWKVILFLIITIPPVYLFNKIYETNYMFLNWPIANSPLMSIQQFFGESRYILGLVVVLLAVWIIQYSLWGLWIVARKAK